MSPQNPSPCKEPGRDEGKIREKVEMKIQVDISHLHFALTMSK